jgi:hypothetical protein
LQRCSSARHRGTDALAAAFGLTPAETRRGGGVI